MKKLVSIVLFVLLTLSCFSAVAEEFALRNGIMFGDTMETVLSKETFAIDEVKDEIEEGSSESDYPYWIETQEGTLAGIEGSYIKYKFDSDKTLKEVIYYFKSYSSKDLSDSDYESVNKGLARKYGSPLSYSGGNCYIFTGDALTDAVISTYIFSTMLDGYGDLRDYDEWVVDVGDFHVKIEQVQYYVGRSYSDLIYSHRMGYTYFTDEDLRAKQDAKMESQAAVDNDL